jgi:hypothetical protein
MSFTIPIGRENCNLVDENLYTKDEYISDMCHLSQKAMKMALAELLKKKEESLFLKIIK